jgi:hypothetical protein
MAPGINMNEVVKTMDVLFITLDSLRYDVAADAFDRGLLPNFKTLFPEGWQKCHSPGSFTFAAHQAFFAGFLPAPAANPKQERLFAAQFMGSETTTTNTLVFETADIVTGFAEKGYKTACIGGVGFFNKQTALGNVLPSYFQESFWEPRFGVTEKNSTAFQFSKAVELIEEHIEQALFLFINVSAIHQPNWFYLHEQKTNDNKDSHAAALHYVDSQLPLLANAFKKKRDTFCIICSDHGTAYGEDDYSGHRIGHPTVWDVPLATCIIKKENQNDR